MITPGRIVLYRLHQYDIDQYKQLATVNNYHQVGDIVPLIVVRVWKDEFGPGKEGVNGQCFMDDILGTLWVTSKGEGTENGTWHWPVK